MWIGSDRQTNRQTAGQLEKVELIDYLSKLGNTRRAQINGDLVRLGSRKGEPGPSSTLGGTFDLDR